MRLVGYMFTSPDGPVIVGHLQIDDMTVVLGPNAAGKSRLVSGLARNLDCVLPVPVDAIGLRSGAFTFSLEPGEARTLLAETRDLDVGVAQHPNHAYSHAEVSAPSATSVAEVAAALQQSRAFSLEWVPGDEATWRVWWTLADPDELSDDTRAAAEEVLGRTPADSLDECESLLMSCRASPWRHAASAPLALRSIGSVGGFPIPLPRSGWLHQSDRFYAASA